MQEEILEKRMYGLTMYNISPIQQGIQFGHAVVEHGLKYFDEDFYQDWAKNWKTFIILNGGTSNDGLYEPKFKGSMETYLEYIKDELNINYAVFREPDLNYCLSAIVFIIDEKVFNFKKYPSYESIKDNSLDEGQYYYYLFGEEFEQILKIRKFISQFKLA